MVVVVVAGEQSATRRIPNREALHVWRMCHQERAPRPETQFVGCNSVTDQNSTRTINSSSFDRVERQFVDEPSSSGSR